MEARRHFEKQMEKKVEDWEKGAKYIGIGILVVTLFFLACYVLMRLWNWLMPEIFDLTIISYWQAVGVMILAKLIFGFGGGDSDMGGNKSKKKGKRKNFAEKCYGKGERFSEWELYDEFWEKEGAQAFEEYAKRAKEDEKDN